MSGKIKRVRHSPSRTDTLIGAGLRIEGNIASTGVLRIQGAIQGGVSCVADSVGTVVVDKSGSITGAVKARHIIVGGRIAGPLHASESIEIQQGAHIAGDAFYREIDIQAGGILEGTLTPLHEPDEDRMLLAHRMPAPAAAAAAAAADKQSIPGAGRPAAESGAGPGPGGRRMIAAAVALLIAALAVAMLNRSPAPTAPPPAGNAPAADSTATQAPAAKPAPAENAGLQGGPKAVAGDAAPAAAGADANARPDAQASPPSNPPASPEQVVKVQGMDPGKPAGYCVLIGKEPAVLLRKKRHDPGDGTRINVAQGKTARIQVAKDEIIRVAEGRDIEIFYQGRKVSPKTIDSGAWMSFVPQLPGRNK